MRHFSPDTSAPVRRLPRGFTFANIMATTALFISLGGTGYAAKRVIITGKNIKNNSVQSVDIKNGTIDKGDLSKLTKQSLQGPEGIPGKLGPVGPRGDAAQIKSAFASFEGARYYNPPGTNPNAGGASWYQYGVTGDNIDDNVAARELTSTDMESGSATMLSLEQNGTGPVGPVDFDSNLSGISSFTLLHRGSVHSRAECQLYMTEAGGSGSVEMGEPVYASSNTPMEMVSVTLVGSKNLTANPSAPRTYNVMVQCRDADWTGQAQDQWEFVRGNVAAYSASR